MGHGYVRIIMWKQYWLFTNEIYNIIVIIYTINGVIRHYQVKSFENTK